jgi:DNA helicase-2/ATP-dependent DNA helicase PcrA
MVAAFAAAKAAREVIDYGDQVALAARIAVRHGAVGTAERARFQVVLLDEYQDTSHAQLVLLRALFGAGHPVTAVGDPCQSIYGWRGASTGNLRRFRRDFAASADGNPGHSTAAPRLPRLALLSALSTSFRNGERILDVAGAIQADLRSEAAEVPRLVPAPDRAGRGEVACALLPTAADEAGWVAQRLAELLSMPPDVAPDGQPWPDGQDGGLRPSQIAVLCRKRAQFPLLRRAIEDLGIPVEVVGLGGLLTVPEVQDVVATLRVLHDPGASDAVARLLTGPRWRIGPADLVALGRRARTLAATEKTAPPGAAAPAAASDAAVRDLASGPVAAPSGPAPSASSAPSTLPVPSGAALAGDDALMGAIADLTAEVGSLVEALDDLGDESGYSPVGYARLATLAAELRMLRHQAGQLLPDLVGDVERVLGLDIEVAARPGADPAAARADLDAFADAAAGFAGDQEQPTLGAFLSYLTAAETEEFGLEAGRVGESDSVKLMTVHAAKGLQWPVVFVPGLSAGEKAQVFPARPRVSSRWTDNPRKLPFALRGDAVDLPGLADLDNAAVTEFTTAAKERDLREERRLAYVAATRASLWLGCSGFWWGEQVSPLGPSIFLTEVRAACAAGAGRVWCWAEAPPQDAQNPVLAQTHAAPWPVAPAGPRYAATVAAGAAVRKALAGSPAAPPEAALGEADRALVTAWARDAGLLLAERAARRGHAAIQVDLPSRLSVSALVSLAADADEFARWVRRPMPRPPAPQARRGTEFHRWLEARFGQQELIDPDDLPGAADDDAAPADAGLALLRARFEAGEWSARTPVAVEVPFETLIADRLVRGRIDAVFSDRADWAGRAGDVGRADGDGRFDVVDWKTGRPASSPGHARAVAVQLAVYRLAWAGLAGVPVDRVRAAFYYVRDDLTVRPADMLDAAGLEALILAVPAVSDR